MRKTKKTMELEFQEYSEIPSNNVMGKKKDLVVRSCTQNLLTARMFYNFT